MEDKKILIAHNGMHKYVINFYNQITNKNEKYVFPEYKHGSKRNRNQYISEACYYYLKDETSAFKTGKLKVVTEDVPDEIKDVQVQAENEVVDTTPEYEDNVLTREDIEKLMRGRIQNIKQRLEKVETSTQKEFIIATIKDLGITNVEKLREVVRVLYGSEMEFEYVFPPVETQD